MDRVQPPRAEEYLDAREWLRHVTRGVGRGPGRAVVHEGEAAAVRRPIGGPVAVGTVM